jgi:HK97 family phage major capsid protein
MTDTVDPRVFGAAVERALTDVEAKRTELLAEATGLLNRTDGNPQDEDRYKEIEAELDRLDKGKADFEAMARLAASGEVRIERGSDTGPGYDPTLARQDQTSALRTINQYNNVLRSDAADTLDDLVRHRDPTGIDSRYLAAVGDPHYNAAVGKLLSDPQTGHLRFSPQEVEAVRRVSAVMYERGMTEGTGSAGGFAIPFSLDPSVLLTSNGALNPIRTVATVITIGTREWKGVSSVGVVASYDAEAAEVSDDSPVLAQPTMTTAMGRAWVPYSIELSQDWATIQQELTRLITDARDVLDAVRFYSGTGTDSPAGVRTGLTTTQRVQTDVAATFDVDDAYDIKSRLPARFMPNATWAAHPTKWDTIFRFTPSGSTTEPQALPTRDGAFIGRPKIEWTAIPTALTSGTTQLLYGDFAVGFRIADRLGMTAEIVSHTFGAAGRPKGERGIFCYWRTGSKTVVPEALRYLETL